MTTPSIQEVAERLTSLCNDGMHHEAMVECYADNARHIEPTEMPGSPYKRVTEGKQELLKMSEHWRNTTEVHSAKVSAPLINGNQFICESRTEVTFQDGPMAGQRTLLAETCLYTVEDSKIIEAKFFYACDD